MSWNPSSVVPMLGRYRHACRPGGLWWRLNSSAVRFGHPARNLSATCAAFTELKPLSIACTTTPSSGIRKIMDAAWALEADGVDVIHLEVGQPNFDAPASAVEAAKDAVGDPKFQRYIPNAGLEVTRDAVANMYTSRGNPTSKENIIVTQGCMFAVTTALCTLLDAGDEVLCPDPGWPNYEMCISLLKGTPTYYTLDSANGFQPDFESLKEKVTSKTKCIVLCNPSNPTGAVFDKHTLSKLVEFARENGLYLVSDEIYGDIYYNPSGEYCRAPSVLDVDHDAFSTIVLSGVSKSYSMTGFRVGWLRAHPDIIKIGLNVQEAFVSCGVATSQLAAAAALNDKRSVVTDMVEAYQERRDIAVQVLKNHGMYTYTPTGAFYVLIDTHGGLGGTESSMDFAQRLLQQEHVAVAPGDTFGSKASRFIRVSLATDTEKVQEGIERICRFIKAS